MKVLALDLGDSWVGTALSDPMKIIARPHETVKTKDLFNFLKNIFETEQIDTVLVGYPRTMRGTESAQTKKNTSTKRRN